MNAPTGKIEAQSLIGALAKALPELESAKKNKANPAFKSKYADLAAVIEAVEPIKEHGLWYRQHSHESADGVTVETFYIHESGDQLSAGTLHMPATKRDAQGFGSALSYARRYALQLAFGLATEDDDGNAASKAAGGSGRDNTGDRQASPDTGTANTSQPSGRINEVQLSKLQMLLKATKTDPLSFCREMGAPEGAQLFQMLQEKYPDALTTLETRLADMAKAETNSAAASGFGELLDDEIKY